MKKWVKVKDNKVIELSQSKNAKFLKKLGFQQLEVEESEKGGLYLKGTAPTWTSDEVIENEFQQDKNNRTKEMETLTVEIDGYVFQADETSQNRMCRAITVLSNSSQEITWITADNQIVNVTREQLQRALRAAVEAQTVIWHKPHNNKNNKKNQ